MNAYVAWFNYNIGGIRYVFEVSYFVSGIYSSIDQTYSYQQYGQFDGVVIR